MLLNRFLNVLKVVLVYEYFVLIERRILMRTRSVTYSDLEELEELSHSVFLLFKLLA